LTFINRFDLLKMVGTPDPPDPGINTTNTINTNTNNQQSYAEVAALATAPSTEVLNLMNSIEQQLQQADASFIKTVHQYINKLINAQWVSMLQRASQLPAKFLLDCIFTIQLNINSNNHVTFKFNDNNSHLQADDAESVFTQLNEHLKYDLASTIKKELNDNQEKVQQILSTPNHNDNATIAATRQQITDASNLLLLIESDYYRISLASNDLACVETAPRRSPLDPSIDVKAFF